MGKYYARAKKGYFQMQNIEKYLGNPRKCIYRSNIEFKHFLWFDSDPDVLDWVTEPAIKYFFEGKQRNYHIDVVATMRNRNGTTTKYMIEIKPSNKIVPPKKRNSKKYTMEVKEYEKNVAKWRYARVYAEDNGYVFGILTEKDEFIIIDQNYKFRGI